MSPQTDEGRGSSGRPIPRVTLAGRGVLAALVVASLFHSSPALAATSYLVTREGSSYRAAPQGAGTTYTGTLKHVMESAARAVHSAGGGAITFATGVFDFGSEYFRGVNIAGITFQGQGMDVTVLQNNSSASADTEPFNMSDAVRITVRDMTVIARGPFRSTSDALDFDGGNDVLIERVKITAARGRGIVFDGKDIAGSVARTADRNIVRDCRITGAGVLSDGIELLASSRNRIERCTITDVGGHGIQITKASTIADQPNKKSNENLVVDNRVENSGQDGINVSSGDRNEIRGNTVLNSSDDTSGRDGIRISSSDSVNCDDNVVSANTSSDNQATKTQRYGLSIASSRCNRTVVWQNTFSGNLSGAINDQGTDTRYSAPPGTDTQAPTAPGNLTATAVSSSRVDLSWNASTDNVGVTGYEIFRNGSLLTSVGTVTSYSDTTVAPSTTYQYQVRARDAAGNRSGFSNTATVTTPAPPDTQAPTPPGNLTATAVSSGRVDLSWNASSDNVGVTGYEIFRDGSLLTSVGTETSYSDTTVSPSTRYQYQVRARDAAGNRSDFSNTENVTTPSGDTESPTPPGNLTAIAVSGNRVDLSWDASSDNMGVTGYEIFRDGAMIATVGPVTTYSDTTVSALTIYEYQVRARDAAGNRSDFSNTATVLTPISTDNEAPTAPTNLTATAVDSSRVDLSWDASTDNVGVSAYEIFRDGSFLAEVGTQTAYSDTTVSPSTTYRYQVRARDAAGNRSDFSNSATVSTPEPPDTQAPTAPGNLTATAVNTSRVDLSWQASSDNVGVTGYEIFRNGSLLTSVGTVTSYSDTTVSPSTTYQYQVRAGDAAGNRSGFSNTASVTTPAAGTPGIFSDGFETGNFSNWTANTGLVAQQQQVYAGSWAARGTSSGSATWAYKQLGSTYTELYYRIRFKVLSQATASNSTMYLLKFRTGSGTSLLGLFRSPTGKLGYRNDIAGAATTSSATVTTGVWHEVQVRVRVGGSSGQTEVWLDGVRIADLSKAENFGTTPIGRIQLGENSTGRTYDVAFDEVVANTSFIA